MNVRVRFKNPENPVRYILGKDLVPHALNWRSHPIEQENALRGTLAEVGLTDVLKVVEVQEGVFQLVDGHLRAEILPDTQVPVLVLDLTPDEVKKMLLTHDAVGGMATVNAGNLSALMDQVQFESAAVNDMLAKLAQESLPQIGAGDGAGDGTETPTAGGEPVNRMWGVLVNLEDEQAQVRLLELLATNGYENVRPLVP